MIRKSRECAKAHAIQQRPLLESQRAAQRINQDGRRLMLVQLRTLAFLTLALGGWRPMGDGILLYVQSAESGQKTIDAATQERADKDMNIGRYYFEKGNYLGAINRFKIVVTQYPTSSHAEEALARLAELFLAIGMPSEAQNAVAVLDRKFPNGRWSSEARSELEAAGLEPVENENSWMAVPFK
jgi:tetratricopeptide (TPR) repeat protein